LNISNEGKPLTDRSSITFRRPGLENLQFENSLATSSGMKSSIKKEKVEELIPPTENDLALISSNMTKEVPVSNFFQGNDPQPSLSQLSTSISTQSISSTTHTSLTSAFPRLPASPKLPTGLRPVPPASPHSNPLTFPSETSSPLKLNLTEISSTPPLTSANSSISATSASLSTNSSAPQTETTTTRPSSYLVPNFLIIRAGTRPFEVESLGFSRSFNRSFSGSQRPRSVEVREGKLLPDSSSFCHVVSTNYLQQIECVTKTRKMDRLKSIQEMGHRQPKSPILFQYKHYSQQTPLNLSKELMDELLSAVTSPRPEVRLIASKILIKVLIDKFFQNGNIAASFLFNLVCHMMGYQLNPPKASETNPEMDEFRRSSNASGYSDAKRKDLLKNPNIAILMRSVSDHQLSPVFESNSKNQLRAPTGLDLVDTGDMKKDKPAVSPKIGEDDHEKKRSEERRKKIATNRKKKEKGGDEDRKKKMKLTHRDSDEPEENKRSRSNTRIRETETKDHDTGEETKQNDMSLRKISASSGSEILKVPTESIKKSRHRTPSAAHPMHAPSPVKLQGGQTNDSAPSSARLGKRHHERKMSKEVNSRASKTPTPAIGSEKQTQEPHDRDSISSSSQKEEKRTTPLELSTKSPLNASPTTPRTELTAPPPNQTHAQSPRFSAPASLISPRPFQVPEIPEVQINHQPMAVRLHALNIIFNLCIHANMMESIPIGSEGQGMAVTHRTLNHLRCVVNQLLTVVCHFQEKNSKLLEWLLKCFLMLNTTNGKIDKQALLLIDRSFIGLCFENLHHDNRNQFYSILNDMLVNYVIPNKTLDPGRLLAVGGWRVIAKNYLNSHLLRSRDNYFVVLYDCVIRTLLQEKKIDAESQRDQEQTHFFIRLLRSIDFPQHIDILFKLTPKDFISDFLNFLSRQHLRLRQSANASNIPATLDFKLLTNLLQVFVSLGKAYQEPSTEYLHFYKALLASTDFDTKIQELKKCVENGSESDRHNVSLILFLMRISKYDTTLPSQPETIAARIPEFCAQLATSESSIVRDVYIRSTDRVLLSLCYRYLANGNDLLAKEMCDIFNNDCCHVLSVSQGSENILSLTDLMFSFLINDTMRTFQSPKLREFMGDSDTRYRLILLGFCSVASKFLSMVRVDILCKLFQRLSSRSYGDPKVALLVLIIRKCSTSKECMEEVGMPYFCHLVESSHPEVAFLASKFLLDQLQSQTPEKYKEIFNRILSTAQQTNDVSLMGNQYLQMRAILRGTL
jgi:hypothetical protein